MVDEIPASVQSVALAIVPHDQGPFTNYAWLEENQEHETKDFVTQIDEATDAYVFALTGNDKLMREDVAEADKKFVYPFLCPICFYIVLEKNVQCHDCQQIFDDHCLKKWFDQTLSCPSCKADRFNASTMNRNLRNQLEIVDFECKCCSQLISYKDRRTHSRTCPSLTIQGCPFLCGKMFQGNYETLKEHLVSECNSKRLNCPACDYKIYRNYNNVNLISEKHGHNCLRDHGSSPQLIANLITTQKRLLLLDGEIPDECKPS